MERVIVIGSTVTCTDGKGGTVSHIVIDPQSKRLGYIEVHRGLIFTHDHCVPAGDIQAASLQEVTLKISTQELEALPALEAKNPATGFYQRSVPESYVSLAKEAITNPDGNVIGHFHGVSIGPSYQVMSIVLGEDENARIPIDDFTELSETGLSVKREASLAHRSRTTGQSPEQLAADMDRRSASDTAGTDETAAGMTGPSGLRTEAPNRSEVHQAQLSPTAQKVLSFLQTHPGDVFTPDDICEQADCSTPQARVALEALVTAGIVQKQYAAGGVEHYIYHPR